MPAHPKEIVDGAMNGEEALDVSERFKPPHVAFPLAGGLMGDFGPVVGILCGAVVDRGEGGPLRRAVAPEFIGDQAIGDVPQPLQQFPKEPFGRPGTPAFLHENIECLPVLIHGPPQVVAFPPDPDEQLVQMPGVARLSAAVVEPLGKRLAELQTPATNRFMGHGHPAFG